MLDLGVGGGRTTLHFAPLVKEYVGVDYSEPMIKLCRERFPQYVFKAVDARNMALFHRAKFDFILFSHNGLDYVPHADRRSIMMEISRVLKPHGIFAFSTHNIKSVANLYSSSPTLKSLLKKILFQVINRFPINVENRTYAVLNDGSCQFKLRTHYVNIQSQLKDLESMGFRDVQLLSGSTGELILPKDIDNNRGPWIYFLCTR